MTSLSCVRPPLRRPPLEKRPSTSIAKPWHVLCILPLVSGCYFFLPLVPVEENMPPEILASSPDEGEILILDLDVTRVFVIVDEPDGDEFVCQWSIDGIGDLGPGEPLQGSDIEGCQLSVGRYLAYDERTLTCRVFDKPSYDAAQREWLIEVVEEGS